MLTSVINKNKLENILINPSYVFLPIWLNPHPKYTNYPNVLNDTRYNKDIICNHLWGSTNNAYIQDYYDKFFYNNYQGVSILLPVYNENIQYLQECIESIISQDFIYIIELVIVNDGSEIEVQNYLNNLVKLSTQFIRFNIIHLESNKGLVNALNIGLQNCKYEIVFRMDSDDIMHKDRIKIQYEYFVKNNLNILGCSIEMFYENNKKPNKIIKHPNTIDKNYLKKKKSLWFVNHPTIVFRKCIILEQGGYVKSDIPEDFDLWIRLLSKNYIINNISDVLLKYRRTNKNITKKCLSKHIVSKMVSRINSL